MSRSMGNNNLKENSTVEAINEDEISEDLTDLEVMSLVDKEIESEFKDATETTQNFSTKIDLDQSARDTITGAKVITFVISFLVTIIIVSSLFGKDAIFANGSSFMINIVIIFAAYCFSKAAGIIDTNHFLKKEIRNQSAALMFRESNKKELKDFFGTLKKLKIGDTVERRRYDLLTDKKTYEVFTIEVEEIEPVEEKFFTPPHYPFIIKTSVKVMSEDS